MKNEFAVGQLIYRNGLHQNDHIQFVVLEKLNDSLYKLQAVGNNFATLADATVAGVNFRDNIVVFPREEKLPDFVRFQWFRDEVIYITDKFQHVGGSNKYWQCVELNEAGEPDTSPCGWRPWDLFVVAQGEKPASVVHYR